MATEKIFVGIDNEKIELTGTDKEVYVKQRAKDQAEQALLETEYQAKRDARASALTKLAEVAGLTEDELNAIL